jgi:hypothetical protein
VWTKLQVGWHPYNLPGVTATKHCSTPSTTQQSAQYMQLLVQCSNSAAPRGDSATPDTAAQHVLVQATHTYLGTERFHIFVTDGCEALILLVVPQGKAHSTAHLRLTGVRFRPHSKTSRGNKRNVRLPARHAVSDSLDILQHATECQVCRCAMHDFMGRHL